MMPCQKVVSQLRRRHLCFSFEVVSATLTLTLPDRHHSSLFLHSKVEQEDYF